MSDKGKNLLTTILAISGTSLVSLPLLAPIIFSLIFFLRSGMFHFDYLMPAELFPLVLVGGGLLLWSAIRMRSYIKFISWSYGLAIFLLIASQAIAVLSGLASGNAEPSSSPWIIVAMSGLIGYNLLVILMTISGIKLLASSRLFVWMQKG